MKMIEYLRELRLNLETKLSPEELEDILADYEGFFLSGKEEGKSEDSTSDELGSPALLAKTLTGGREAKPYVPYKGISTPGKRLCAYLMDAVIACIPAFLLFTLVLKLTLLPPLLLITYPSPLAGALLSGGFSTMHQAFADDSRGTLLPGSKIVYYADGTEREIPVVDHNKPAEDRTRLIITVSAVIGIGFYLLYSFLCTLFLKGQTLGKKLMKIRVKQASTTTIRSGSVFFREVIGKTLLNSIPLIPLISFFTILFTKEHQALHDMLSDTIVSDL